MPYGYSFRYDVNKKTMFRDNLKNEQCRAISKTTGQRCSRNTCIGLGYCWYHLRTECKLKIKETGDNRGKGLYADNGTNNNEIVFKANQKICDYGGERVNVTQINRRYGKDKTYPRPYVTTVSEAQNIYEDAAIQRGIGSLANHICHSSANARLSVSGEGNNKKSILKAGGGKKTKYIRNGQEILVRYDERYKIHHNSVKHKTRYGKLLTKRTLRRYDDDDDDEEKEEYEEKKDDN